MSLLRRWFESGEEQADSPPPQQPPLTKEPVMSSPLQAPAMPVPSTTSVQVPPASRPATPLRGDVRGEAQAQSQAPREGRVSQAPQAKPTKRQDGPYVEFSLADVVRLRYYALPFARWWDNFYMDYGILLLARIMWAANCYFTVSAVMWMFSTVVPLIVGVAFGLALHIFISKFEGRLWEMDDPYNRLKNPRFFLFACGVIFVDIATSTIGLVDFTKRFFRFTIEAIDFRNIFVVFQVLGHNIAEFFGQGRYQSFPTWTPELIIFVSIASFIAVCSEKLLRVAKDNYQETLRARFDLNNKPSHNKK